MRGNKRKGNRNKVVTTREYAIDLSLIEHIKTLAGLIDVRYYELFRVSKGDITSIKLDTAEKLIRHFNGGELPEMIKNNVDSFNLMAVENGINLADIFNIMKSDVERIQLDTLCKLLEHFNGGELPAPFKENK